MKVLTIILVGVKLRTIQKENGGFYMKKWIALVCSCMLLFAGCSTKEEGTAGSGQTSTQDPVKTNVVEITKLNLVEITRKKIRRPLYEQVAQVKEKA